MEKVDVILQFDNEVTKMWNKLQNNIKPSLVKTIVSSYEKLSSKYRKNLEINGFEIDHVNTSISTLWAKVNRVIIFNS